jgi:hypothetical protein
MEGTTVSTLDDRFVLPSLTRIADLDDVPFSVEPIDRAAWVNGQYVAVAIRDSPIHREYEIELRDGRIARLAAGDRLIGALGRRSATLQIVGDWESLGPGTDMDLLSMAGVIGACTSRSPFAAIPAPLTYLGHVVRPPGPVTMGDFAPVGPAAALEAPVVLIIGTSMDAGKTLAASRLIRILTGRGLSVAAAKLTGVGRYRDVLAMGDAGASWILDFVDVGLPSTVVPADEFEAAGVCLLARLGALGADVVMAEAGASPLEPYNGDTAVRLLGEQVRCVVLCASDPYAALGVMDAFGVTPSFIAGRATATSAGAALTARLTGRPVVNLLDPAEFGAAEALLVDELGLADDGASVGAGGGDRG